MSVPKRWPKNAEAARSETQELARESVGRLNQARREIKRNPLLAELMIADTVSDLERIWRLMETAKQGDE